MSYARRLLDGKIGLLTLIIRDYLILSHIVALIVYGSICPMFYIPLPPVALLVTMIRLLLIYGMWMRAKTFVYWKRYCTYFLMLPITFFEIFLFFSITQFILITPYPQWDKGFDKVNQSIYSVNTKK